MTQTQLDMLPTSTADGVVTVVLDQPGNSVIVLDRDLIRRLELTLRDIGTSHRGLILRSASERVFVAGADLNEFQDTDDQTLHKYLELGARTFGMLASFPFPTVAAINGAALGGGLEIAMHCDGLVAAPSASGKAYPIGLPEAGLGLCPGWGGTNLLPARMDPSRAIQSAAEGKPLKFDDAVDAGLFDAVAQKPEGLTDACMAWLESAPTPKRDGAPSRWIGRSPGTVVSGLNDARHSLPDTDASRAVANAVNIGLTQGWDEAIKAERSELVGLRHTKTAQSALEAFFSKAKG